MSVEAALTEVLYAAEHYQLALNRQGRQRRPWEPAEVDTTDTAQAKLVGACRRLLQAVDDRRAAGGADALFD